MFFILLYRRAGRRYHPPPRKSSNPKFPIAREPQPVARSLRDSLRGARSHKEKSRVEQSYHLERRSIL